MIRAAHGAGSLFMTDHHVHMCTFRLRSVRCPGKAVDRYTWSFRVIVMPWKLGFNFPHVVGGVPMGVILRLSPTGTGKCHYNGTMLGCQGGRGSTCTERHT